MVWNRISISRPDIKLHKEFHPLIGENQTMLRGISMIAARNLAFARALLDRYSGRFFYDFDMSSFVFLDKLMPETGNDVPASVTEVHIHNHPVSRMFITSKIYRVLVRHLQWGNRIAPARLRLQTDFARQTFWVQQIQNQMRSQHIENVLPYRQLLAVRDWINGGSPGSLTNAGDLQILSAAGNTVVPQSGGRAWIWDRVYRWLYELTGVLEERRGSAENVEGSGFVEALSAEPVQDFGSESVQALSADQREEILRHLRVLAKEKALLVTVSEQFNREWNKHNFENFEEEKLCFLGVLENYTKQHKEYFREENDGLQNLVYRVTAFDENQWQSFRAQMPDWQRRLAEIDRLQAYVNRQDEAVSKRAGWYLEMVKTLSVHELDRLSQQYETMVSRHEVVAKACRAFIDYEMTHGQATFFETKKQLLRYLENCRRQHKELFTDENTGWLSALAVGSMPAGRTLAGRTPNSGTLNSRTPDGSALVPLLMDSPIWGAALVDEHTASMLQFECLTAGTLKRLERSDRRQWQQWMEHIHAYNREPWVFVRREFYEENKKLLSSVTALKSAVTDLQKVYASTEVFRQWLETPDMSVQKISEPAGKTVVSVEKMSEPAGKASVSSEKAPISSEKALLQLILSDSEQNSQLSAAWLQRLFTEFRFAESELAASVSETGDSKFSVSRSENFETDKISVWTKMLEDELLSENKNISKNLLSVWVQQMAETVLRLYQVAKAGHQVETIIDREEKQYLHEMIRSSFKEDFENHAYVQSFGRQSLLASEIRKWEDRQILLGDVYREFLQEMKKSRFFTETVGFERILEDAKTQEGILWQKQLFIRLIEQRQNRFSTFFDEQAFGEIRTLVFSGLSGNAAAAAQDDLTDVFGRLGSVRLMEMSDVQWRRFLEVLDTNYSKESRSIIGDSEMTKLLHRLETDIEQKTLAVKTEFSPAYWQLARRYEWSEKHDEQLLEKSCDEQLISHREHFAKNYKQFLESQKQLMTAVQTWVFKRENTKTADVFAEKQQLLDILREHQSADTFTEVLTDVLKQEQVAFIDTDQWISLVEHTSEEQWQEVKKTLRRSVTEYSHEALIHTVEELKELEKTQQLAKRYEQSVIRHEQLLEKRHDEQLVRDDEMLANRDETFAKQYMQFIKRQEQVAFIDTGQWISLAEHTSGQQWQEVKKILETSVTEETSGIQTQAVRSELIEILKQNDFVLHSGSRSGEIFPGVLPGKRSGEVFRMEVGETTHMTPAKDKAAARLKEREEQLSLLATTIENQQLQLETMTRVQTELKKQIKDQNEDLRQAKRTEKAMPEYMLRQLHTELRMERLRKGLE